MVFCPTCEENAEEKVHVGESRELAGGPPVRVCHGSDGAYVHVMDDESEEVSE